MVTWQAFVWEESPDSKTSIRKDLKVQRCDEKHFEKFYPPSKTYEKQIEKLKANKTFWCFDREYLDGSPMNTSMFGLSDMDVSRIFDFTFTPCIPKQITDENRNNASKECLADLKNDADMERKLNQSIEYLG